MAEFQSYTVTDGPGGSSGETVRYNPGAFSDAQAKLNSAIEALAAITERFSASADTLIGSIEGPVSAFEGCTESLKASLLVEVYDLVGMVNSLSNSLNEMVEADRRKAAALEHFANPTLGPS